MTMCQFLTYNNKSDIDINLIKTRRLLTNILVPVGGLRLGLQILNLFRQLLVFAMSVKLTSLSRSMTAIL